MEKNNSQEVVKKKSIFQKELAIGGVSDEDILLFTKHLSVTLQSGLTLTESLEILVDQAKGKMKKVLEGVLNRICAGESLHSAFEAYPKYFSPIYINMIKTGELSGNLDENLQRLYVDLDKAHTLKKKIKSAMLYPMLVFVAVFGLGMSVALFVLPKIIPLFQTLDVELPLTTRGLIWVANVFEQYGVIIFTGSVIGFILFLWFVKRNFMKPYTHWLILKLPVVKHIAMNMNLERFTRTFGTLLGSGLTVDQSLNITAHAIENRVYRKAVLALMPQIQSGQSLVMAMAEHDKLFPVIVIRMIGVGEKTGNLDNSLKYLSGFYEDQVDDVTKNLSTIIEPVLLIFIGIVVGTVAISILGPIYQITGSLRG